MSQLYAQYCYWVLLCFVVSHTLVQLQRQLQWNVLSNGLVGVYSLKTHAFASIDVDKFYCRSCLPGKLYPSRFMKKSMLAIDFKCSNEFAPPHMDCVWENFQFCVHSVGIDVQVGVELLRVELKISVSWHWELASCVQVGLPNVGKSTLFNTLTKLSIPAMNFPFCTIEPNEARVYVPDERFDWLCQLFKPKSEVWNLTHSKLMLLTHIGMWYVMVQRNTSDSSTLCWLKYWQTLYPWVNCKCWLQIPSSEKDWACGWICCPISTSPVSP